MCCLYSIECVGITTGLIDYDFPELATTTQFLSPIHNHKFMAKNMVFQVVAIHFNKPDPKGILNRGNSFSPGRCGCYFICANSKYNLGIDNLNTQEYITMTWLPEDHVGGNSTLAPYHQTARHYLNRYWQSHSTPCGAACPKWVEYNDPLLAEYL